MHTTQLSLARPCTTNHHASERRAAVWSALLSVLILTAAVVAPAVAGLPDIPAPGTSFAKMDKPPVKVEPPGFDPNKSCNEIAAEAANKVRKETGSESAAQREYTKVKNKCLESRR